MIGEAASCRLFTIFIASLSKNKESKYTFYFKTQKPLKRLPCEVNRNRK